MRRTPDLVRRTASLLRAPRRTFDTRGDASSASVRGVSAFNGRSTSNAFDRSAATQDTLASLAEDTGGRAFFDTNQFAGVFDLKPIGQVVR